MNTSTLENSIDGYIRKLEEKNMSPATVDAYSCDAKQYINFLESNSKNTIDINTIANLEFYIKTLNTRICENSLRRKIISLKHFISYLLKSELNINYKTPQHIPSRIESNPYEFNDELIKKCILHLNSGEVVLKKYRDLAIFSLLSLEGLKVTELINLKVKDIKTVGENLYVEIRGSKQRGFIVQKQTGEHLKDYISYLERTEFSFDLDHLFLGFKGANIGKVAPSMTRHGVKFFINELSDQINEKLCAEKLRQHAIFHHISLGKTIVELMQHFGLRQPGVIQKYFNLEKKNEPKR